MNKRKLIPYISGGALIIILVVIFALKRPYSSKLPEIPENPAISGVVRDQIEDALFRAKRKPNSQNLGRLGMVFHSSANYSEAASCYRLAIKKDSTDWIWSYYLGHLGTEMSENELITENFSRVLEVNPDAYQAWYYLGLEFKNHREYKKAESCFNNIVALNNKEIIGSRSTRADQFPLAIYASFQLARTYFDKGDIQQAENTLKEILEISHMFGPAYRLLGNIYSTRGDMVQSKLYGVRANDLKQFTPPVDTLMDRVALMSKSEIYLLKKIDEAVKSIHPDWALRLIRNGLQYFPENGDLIAKAVNVSLWMNLTDQAFAFSDQHINMFRDNFDEIRHTGMLYFQKEAYPAALKYLGTAMQINQGDLQVQKSMVISLWRAGDRQQAMELINQIINSNPENLEVLAEVTDMMFFDLGQGQQAIEYFIMLDHFLPENPKVQKISAWVAENNGRTVDAISMYESSFKGDPNDFVCIKNLGSLYTRGEMWKEAIDLYRRALDFHPNEQYFLERLGTILVTCPDEGLVNIEEGREYSERAFFHFKGQTTLTIYAGRSLAMAFSLLGDKESAKRTILMTINLARSKNFSAENIALLEKFAAEL